MITTLGEGGKLVLPDAYLKAPGLKPGDEVLLILEDGEIRIMGKSQAIKRAQKLVRRYIPDGRSLSEELLQERRGESIHN